jgi:hypothetical protein
MHNVFVYLVGPPGVGKYTVGKILEQKLPGILVDNHQWLNPVFRLIRQDGVTPLPAAVWPLVAEIRRAVLAGVATLSPRDWNFIVTHAAVGDLDDVEIAEEILATAARRGARTLVARLICSSDALAERVVHSERNARMKEMDPEAARRNAVLPPFDPGHPDTVTIDTTSLTAPAVADHIVRTLTQTIPEHR